MSQSQVFAPAKTSSDAADEGSRYSVITRDANDDLWTIHIFGVSEQIARETADALNRAAIGRD